MIRARFKYRRWGNKWQRCTHLTSYFSGVSEYRLGWVQRLKLRGAFYFLNYRIMPIQAIVNIAMFSGRALGLLKFFYKYYIKFLRANFSLSIATQYKAYVAKDIVNTDYFSYLQLSKVFYDFNQVLFWRLIEGDLYIRVRPKVIKHRGKKYTVRKFQFYLPKDRIYLALRAFRTYFMLTNYNLKHSKKHLKALSAFFLKSTQTCVLAHVKLQLYRLYLLSIR